MVFTSLDDMQLDTDDNTDAIKKVVVSGGTRNNKMVQNQSSMERPVRGRSHLSNGREAERRYNSLERYLQSQSNGNISLLKHTNNKDYEKLKRGP